MCRIVAAHPLPEIHHGFGGHIDGGGRIDNQVIAKFRKLCVFKHGRAAAFHHIGQRQDARKLLVDTAHFSLGFRRLNKDNIRASFLVGMRALHGRVDAVHGARVGAGHNHEVGIDARVHSGVNLADHLLHRDNLAADHMAALLGHHLILKLDHSHARLFILANGAHDIDGVSKSGVRVRDHGHAAAFHQVGRTGDHLAHRHKPHVGLAQMAG